MPDPPTQRIHCPACFKHFRILESQHSDMVECPYCHRHMVISNGMAWPGSQAPKPQATKSPPVKLVIEIITGMVAIAAVIIILAVRTDLTRPIISGTALPDPPSSTTTHRSLPTTDYSGKRPWDRPFEFWIQFCNDRGMPKRSSDYDNDGFYAADAQPEGVYIRTQYIDGRMDDLMVGKFEVQGDEAFEDVLNVWSTIAPDLVPLFRELRRESTNGFGKKRLPGTDYTYSCYEINKCDIQWAGSEENHKLLIKQSEEITDLVLCWYAYAKNRNAKMAEIIARNDANKTDDLIKLLEFTAFEFGNPNVINTVYRVTSCPVEDSEFLEPEIPSAWPECSKLKLQIAMARCSDAYARAARAFKFNRELEVPPFNELTEILSDKGLSAAECMFDRLWFIEEHKRLMWHSESKQDIIMEMLSHRFNTIEKKYHNRSAKP